MRKLIAHIFSYNPGPDDMLSRLEKYKGLSNRLVGFGLFAAIIYIKLDLARYPAIYGVTPEDVLQNEVVAKIPAFFHDLWKLLTERGVELLFFVFIWIWYRAYDINADRELKILGNLYSNDKAPHDWSSITGGRLVPFLAIGITLSFLVILLVSGNVLVLCAVILLLLCQDAFANSMVRRNILQHFYNPAFDPDTTDPLREVLLKRRKVALDYWVWRPHLSRIGLAMCVTCLVAALCIFGHVGPFPVSDNLLRTLLAVMIAANELTIASWRIARDESFAALDQELQGIRKSLQDGEATARPA